MSNRRISLFFKCQKCCETKVESFGSIRWLKNEDICASPPRTEARNACLSMAQLIKPRKNITFLPSMKGTK
jgi:hypothetical protein